MTVTTIRASEPRDLLAYLPYRLGFRPHRSVVVVSLRGARGRVGLVARVDLDDLADEQAGETVGSGLASHVWRDGAQRAVVVVYDEASRGPEHESARAAAVENIVRRPHHGLERAHDVLDRGGSRRLVLRPP